MGLQREQLDRARREWLAGLARQHERQPSAATAMQLADGEWKCGEYVAALEHFTVARDLAPALPDAHVALVCAASMMGLGHIEDAALDAGLRAHPRHPRLLLQSALRLVPHDLDRARAILRPVVQDPTCRLYALALDAMNADEWSVLDRHAGEDPRLRAQVNGLRWVLEHSGDRSVHAGLPTDVLLRALDVAPATGLTLECGVYFGRSLALIAARTAGPVHGFDSFQGLPEAWNANERAGAYSTGGRMPIVPANATLHAGWFEHTLPAFLAAHAGPVRLLHVDCDIYTSTRTVLANALPRLAAGSVIVFDDLLGYPGYEQHELRAFEEFVGEHGIGWEIIAACLLGREVALRITRT